MVIYNIKINGSKVYKIFFCFIFFILVIITAIVISRIFKGSANSSNFGSQSSFGSCFSSKSQLDSKHNFSNSLSVSAQNKIYKIEPKNYTNILKSVHENIDKYVGKQINFTGYVYRINDLKNNQFILARNMIISSDMKYVVVGFLCNYENALDFKDGTWVNATGIITKGDYHGDMPIVEVTNIVNTNKPNGDEYVYPPTNDSIIQNNIS